MMSAKKIDDFYRIHAGEVCLVVCNGISLAQAIPHDDWKNWR